MANQLQIPMRGEKIEIRPMYVEEWLDSLPFVDFRNVVAVMHQALEATNQIEMKPAQRLELIGLYDRPYQYYLETQISSGANHTLQSIEMVQNQLGDMKQLALELSSAGRKVMEETMNHRSLWGQNKYPLEAVASSMRYLTHAMIFSFLEYAPVTQGVWKEINFLYQITENFNQQKKTVNLIGAEKKAKQTTLEKLFIRACLTSLADPYHLPFGAIWEIFLQLREWRELSEINSFSTSDKTDGLFVINLNSDNGPIPYIKFNVAKASDKHRIISAVKLQSVIKQLQKDMLTGKDVSKKINISSYYLENILDIAGKAWGNPPKRGSARKTKSGQMNLSHGLNNIYFFLNDEKEFKLSRSDPDDIDTGAAFNQIAAVKTDYKKESWTLVDASSGGIAITRSEKPLEALRVGDLVGLSLDEKNLPKETFRIGILRWLLVKQNKIYKAGLEIINKVVSPAGLKSLTGSLADKEYRRCFITGNPEKVRTFTIIAGKGLYQPDRILEVDYRNRQYQGKIINKIESTTCFDHFEFKLQ